MEETKYVIRGDQHDSPTMWIDFKNDLLRKHGINEFAGPIGSPIQWNINQTVQVKQKSGVRNCVSDLVALSGTSSVRDRVRNIETNNVPGVDLTDLVDQMRCLLEYFDGITAPNDILDGENLERIRNLRYSSSGKANIYNDVVGVFEQYEKLENELQQHSRASEFQKKKKMADLLMHAHESMRTSITSMALTSAQFSYDEFKRRVTEIAQNLSIIKQHDNFTSNSTINSSTNEKKYTLTERELRDILQQRPYESRQEQSYDGRNTYERGRRRSDTRGQYGRDQGSEAASYGRGRSPSPYEKRRSRSPYARGNSRDDFKYTSRPRDRSRSRSRDRTTSREAGNRRYSNSTAERTMDEFLEWTLQRK